MVSGSCGVLSFGIIVEASYSFIGLYSDNACKLGWVLVSMFSHHKEPHLC